ncbi:phage antirepressor KilAC domain-containing protein [Streptomyces scabiei]|uniref:phage antirepressor KilAC domain-containing protein n=1 Tax=Streptomyces scabiei TaxID=1930 RepID=UPI001B300DBA|nr:phage antirepressor KilAC domain-containing protein [Streptomyces sp. LBUM 1475]
MLLDHKGQERWSARDLQQLMEYDEWRAFEDTINRAMAAVEASGLDPLDHFVGAHKVMKGGRWGHQQVKDYRLTRFGAYHVALAGDGRKPAVAAAKTYFAVRTREAELAAKPDLSSPEGVLVLARQYLAAAEELVTTKRELAVAKPKASKWDAFCDSDGLIDMGAAAKAFHKVTGGLGRTKFMDRLREDDLRFLQVQNPRIPYEIHIQKGRAEVKFVPAGYKMVEQTFFTPKGMDWLADKLGMGGIALPAA